jgi:hypothetical protein
VVERDTAMKLSLVVSLVVLLALVSRGTPVLAEPCGGQNHREHNRGDYRFKTSSWVRAEDNGHYYRTCAENLSADNRDLWFDWFVPGPTSYIPPGRSVTSPRYFIDRQSADFLGCLQYGNHRTSMQEGFIGHKNDSEQIEREKEQGCDVSRKVSEARNAPAEVPNLSYSTEIFIPSDSSDVKNTLMQVNLTVSLEKISGESARSTIVYNITPVYADFHGDPTQIRVTSNSPILREALRSRDPNQRMVQLSGFEGNLSFDLPLTQTYTIINVRYMFLDRKEVLVGSIFVPIPSPSN